MRRVWGREMITLGEVHEVAQAQRYFVVIKTGKVESICCRAGHLTGSKAIRHGGKIMHDWYEAREWTMHISENEPVIR